MKKFLAHMLIKLYIEIVFLNPRYLKRIDAKKTDHILK